MKSLSDLELLESNRYRTLVDVSSALATQPDVHAVLHSIAALLSKTVSFDAMILLLRNPDNDTVQVYALESGHLQPLLPIGAAVPFKGTAIATVFETQQPIFLPDARAEMLKIPEFAERIQNARVRSSYIFPVSSPRAKMGVLIFGSLGRPEYSPEDLELVGLVASHLSIALENAFALESAEAFRNELERERDRLRLLLEINNHTVTKLEVNELFRAASGSLREFFHNAYTGFWLYDDTVSQLQCILLDFPESQGCIEDMPLPKLTPEDFKKFRKRGPHFHNLDDFDGMPGVIEQALRAESIVCVASVPLMGTTHPLGIISLGSHEKDAFTAPDMDILGQVANQIALALENALAYGRLCVSRERLEDERQYLVSEIQAQDNFEDIVGKSEALKKVLEQVAIVAPTDSTVLLIGETGTGKELIARAIHNLSTRNKRTFVRLNCAAIPQGLMESELFGHEKGAFTGALTQKRGRVELAHEGSLFLDEIGDLDGELQPKVLRVLQEREFERLGSNQTVKVDLRLIAASHRDLPAMVREGKFREDLFYRLNVFPICIPPLRERKEDIPLLVHYFVAQNAQRMHKTIRVIPSAILEAMMRWPWPGNVRELQNFVERSVILSPGETLRAPISELRDRTPNASATTLHDVEREAILNALRTAHGKISGPGGGAEQLGLKRTTLQRKMERLGISKSEYA